MQLEFKKYSETGYEVFIQYRKIGVISLFKDWLYNPTSSYDFLHKEILLEIYNFMDKLEHKQDIV
jgi:hypothetical protein